MECIEDPTRTKGGPSMEVGEARGDGRGEHICNRPSEPIFFLEKWELGEYDLRSCCPL